MRIKRPRRGIRSRAERMVAPGLASLLLRARRTGFAGIAGRFSGNRSFETGFADGDAAAKGEASARSSEDDGRRLTARRRRRGATVGGRGERQNAARRVRPLSRRVAQRILRRRPPFATAAPRTAPRKEEASTRRSPKRLRRLPGGVPLGHAGEAGGNAQRPRLAGSRPCILVAGVETRDRVLQERGAVRPRRGFRVDVLGSARSGIYGR